jgi:hypothetical protein
LERLFKEGLVLEVVNALNNDKASSHDGIFMSFFQACWDVLKGDLIAMLEVSLKEVLIPHFFFDK